MLIITPMRNEADHIEGVARALAAQTRRPARWVVVNDNSTDATAEIAARLAEELDFMRVVSTPVQLHRQERRPAGGRRRAARLQLRPRVGRRHLGLHPHRQARRRRRTEPRLLRADPRRVRRRSSAGDRGRLDLRVQRRRLAADAERPRTRARGAEAVVRRVLRRDRRRGRAARLGRDRRDPGPHARLRDPLLPSRRSAAISARPAAPTAASAATSAGANRTGSSTTACSGRP